VARQFVLIILLSTLAIGCKAATVVIKDAWIAEGPPSTPVNAGYMQIENTGPDTAILLAIESPRYSHIEMHKSVDDQGMVSMQPIQHIDIAPGEQVIFRPGELHLMLYNTGRPPQDGEAIPLTLRFADGTTRQFTAGVKKMSDYHQHHNDVSQSSDGPGLLAQARVFYQHLLPQHFLSGLMYRLTRVSWSPLKNLLITGFIRLYNVDMSLAVRPEADQYLNFNAFFTRALKPDARPIDPDGNVIVSPVDAAISQYGRISNGKLIQAKGHEYSATELLGGDDKLGKVFAQGEFITLYLSPRDYHRIHMPVSGTLKSMTYVPGDLFSVSPATTMAIDNLFARNERVIQVFDTAIGRVALVMVGAIFVGSMETVWAGEITPAADRQPYTLTYPQSGQTVVLDKGAEMGRFNMGSTVILLFEPDRLQWDTGVRPDQTVRLGQKIAQVK